MKIEPGSFRDPAIARDAKVLSGLGALVVLAVTVPSGLIWMVLGPIILGALTALILLLKPRPAASWSEDNTPVPHPGPNVSRISPAGLPGSVFVAGFLWMFWLGVPRFRPIVVGVAVAGCVAGASLVAIERRRRPPTNTPLGLSRRVELSEHKDQSPPPS
jgi:hypothetical protein